MKLVCGMLEENSGKGWIVGSKVLNFWFLKTKDGFIFAKDNGIHLTMETLHCSI